MTRGDWTYIGVSTTLTKGIDSFLQSDEAKNMSLKNRQQFVNRLITDFFQKYKENRGISYIKYITYGDVLDLLEPGHKKTKKSLL